MHFYNYLSKIIFAKKQIFIFIIMLLSGFFVLLFFLFFNTFTKYYIQELKLVYPTVYLVKNQDIMHYMLPNTEVTAEIFELNDDNIKFSFDGQSTFSLGSIGIRSFYKKHKPKAIASIYEDSNIVFVSQKIYQQLSSNEKFQGSLYLYSDKDAKMHKYIIKEFTLHDNSKWILLQDNIAHELFDENLFNKAVFHSPLEEKLLTSKVQEKFNQHIYSWEEHISLVSRAVKESMVYLFSWITIAIAILSVSSILFFSKALVDDLRALTKNAFFFGTNFWAIYFTYFIISNIVFISLTLTTYLFSYLANNILSTWLWELESFHSNTFLLYLILALVFVSSISIYFTLHKLQSAKYV